MGSLGNKILKNLHIFIILYTVWGMWTRYEEHTLQVEEIVSQFEPLRIEIEKNKKKVSEIEEFQKRTEESKIRVEEVAKNIEIAQRQLPAETNDNQILDFYNKEFAELNIKDNSITPQPEKVTTYFISKPYSIRASGTYLQFLVFFERIANAARIYNVNNLTLRTTSENQRGRFQMITLETSVEAFRYNPDFKVDRGF